MGWYEREITDLFGVKFRGHPEPTGWFFIKARDPSCRPSTRTIQPMR